MEASTESSKLSGKESVIDIEFVGMLIKEYATSLCLYIDQLSESKGDSKEDYNFYYHAYKDVFHKIQSNKLRNNVLENFKEAIKIFLGKIKYEKKCQFMKNWVMFLSFQYKHDGFPGVSSSYATQEESEMMRYMYEEMKNYLTNSLSPNEQNEICKECDNSIAILEKDKDQWRKERMNGGKYLTGIGGLISLLNEVKYDLGQKSPDK